MKETDKNLESRGVSLTRKQWDRCDRLSEEYGRRSRNAFIREAVDFYCAWLEKEHIERFLLPALESVIGAKIRDSEERIRRLLFKLAVDQNLLAHTVAECWDLDPEAVESLRICSGVKRVGFSLDMNGSSLFLSMYHSLYRKKWKFATPNLYFTTKIKAQFIFLTSG